ncbi:MAG: hypothetical protein FWB88_08235 [Defluviitaleaceae bacterium]|nr:hypothetical protein [Defluviitaleaceae bacterium]MCL2239495.1 hypothetical protein [Defluviitaleaceae bacterium]
MPSVGMVGNNGHQMTRAFLHLCHGAANCYHITENQPYGPKLNVLVADAPAPVLSTIIPRLSSEDYLIVNADDGDIFPALGQVQAKVITYGFNPRACITASSVTEEGLQVCIQRAFVDLSGTARTPQEFSAPVTSLGAAAAWAVVGSKHPSA